MSLYHAPGSARSAVPLNAVSRSASKRKHNYARNPHLFWLSQPSLWGSTLQRLCINLPSRLFFNLILHHWLSKTSGFVRGIGIRNWLNRETQHMNSNQKNYEIQYIFPAKQLLPCSSKAVAVVGEEEEEEEERSLIKDFTRQAGGGGGALL